MARHDEGFFSAKDNLRLFWASEVPEAPRAHVGIVHGYGDHLARYKTVTDALVKAGFAVHAYDFRGHGQSDGRRGHTDRFSDYVDDLDLFWARVRKAAGNQKSFLLAHSNGGLTAIHWLAQERPGLAGLILSAPYLRLALKPPALKVLGAKLMGRVIPWLPIKTELTPADLSRDEAWQRETARDALYNTIVTPRWFTESNRAQEAVNQIAPKVRVPSFVFCGEKDPVASTPTTRAFFEHLGAPDKRFKEYPGMLHECLNEIGKEEVFADISQWISERLST